MKEESATEGKTEPDESHVSTVPTLVISSYPHLRQVLSRTIAETAAHLPRGPPTLEAASSRNTWGPGHRYPAMGMIITLLAPKPKIIKTIMNS